MQLTLPIWLVALPINAAAYITHNPCLITDQDTTDQRQTTINEIAYEHNNYSQLLG